MLSLIARLASVVDSNCARSVLGSADRLNYFWLASIVPLCNLFARVTQQVGGPLNAGLIATDFAAKIMLGKPLLTSVSLSSRVVKRCHIESHPVAWPLSSLK
jgi:hypothetical protein